jgi:hypothetical protein
MRIPCLEITKKKNLVVVNDINDGAQARRLSVVEHTDSSNLHKTTTLDIWIIEG